MRKPRRRYHNVKVDGFDSMFERDVYQRLLFELLPGDELVKQVAIKFACGAKYIVDFVVMRNGQPHRYVEAKGVSTSTWKLKMRMLKHEHPDVFGKLEVIKSPEALKREAKAKAKAKATRDAKKATP